MNAALIGREQESLIDIRNLRKSYFSEGIETKVLFGVDLALEHGSFLAIMGQSGSGKSTLMNILGCLDTATQGSYLLNGIDASQVSRSELAVIRNQTIGFVFQSFNLIKRMSVVENVALPLIYAGISRRNARAKALRELERVGLRDYAMRMPNQLSGGQQQRVAIARALVVDPPLVLADEPTGNLDTKTSSEVMALFQTLNAEYGISIVLVTHEPDIAAWAKRLLCLRDGRVLHDGGVAEGLRKLSMNQEQQARAHSDNVSLELGTT
jgi:putative ABC transport system ATP-binding protein